MSEPLIAWDDIQKRYDELSEQVNSSTLDNNTRHVVQKEFSYLSTLLTKQKEIDRLATEKASLEAQVSETDDQEMIELFNEELETISGALEEEHKQLERILFPPDPLDARSAFLEIRAGAGGQEASLFAGDLLRMYTNYASKQNWRAGIVSMSETDVGGIREVVLHIQGKDVYGHLKYESGVHRVQRVPSTESSGRVHTSTATVAVMPEAKEVDLTVNASDLRIDVFRASGAGGQHVNTTDSAVRITHVPTGVVVSCQDERSQHKNKAKAMKMLQSRLLVAKQEKEHEEKSKMRKDLVGSGMRAEKVRTYNFPQNRVTDHQADVTLKKLDIVLEGELDDIVDALMERERVERRKQPLVSQ